MADERNYLIFIPGYLRPNEGFGRKKPSKIVQCYDLQSNTCTSSGDDGNFAIAELPRAQGNCEALVYQPSNQIYVIGGQAKNDSPESSEHSYNAILVYDFVNQKWDYGPALANEHFDSAVAQVDGAIYCISGYNTTSCERLDPREGQWQTIASANYDRCGNGAAVLDGNRIYLAGGHSYAKSTLLNTAEFYDVRANRWESIPDMNERRIDHAVAGVGGRVYAIGGFGYHELLDSEVFNPAVGKWRYIAKCNASRCFASLTAGKDGCLYLAGGRDEDWKFPKTIEKYDPKTDKWTMLPSKMNMGCTDGTAVFLSGHFN